MHIDSAAYGHSQRGEMGHGRKDDVGKGSEGEVGKSDEGKDGVGKSRRGHGRAREECGVRRWREELRGAWGR